MTGAGPTLSGKITPSLSPPLQKKNKIQETSQKKNGNFKNPSWKMEEKSFCFSMPSLED